MGAIAGAAIVAAGSIYSAQSAQNSRDDATAAAQGSIDSIAGMSDAELAAAFGDKLDPSQFLYEPVDITQSQLDTLAGNQQALPGAVRLMQGTNRAIWQNDLERIRTLMPGYDSYVNSYLGTTAKLQAGELPYEDVMGIVGDSASLAGALGTPGGSRATTLKDLGLSRLDAMDKGNSMFAGFVDIAEKISPNSKQLTPQSSFLSPSERLSADITQAALEQQGRASAEIARASPDPAQNALVEAQLGFDMANLGASYNPSNSSQMLAAGLSQAGSMLSQYYGKQTGQANQMAQPTSGYNLDYPASVPSYGSSESLYSSPDQPYSPSLNYAADPTGSNIGATSPGAATPYGGDVPAYSYAGLNEFGNIMSPYYGSNGQTPTILWSGQPSASQSFNTLIGTPGY